MTAATATPAAIPATATLCHGAEDEHGHPMCQGPDVRTVRAYPPDGSRQDDWFMTDWCAECRAIADADGYLVLVPAKKVAR